VALPSALTERLARAFDAEGKIPRALDALGPIGDRDVLLIDGTDPEPLRARQLSELGGRVRRSDSVGLGGLPGAGTDTVVSYWSWFRDNLPADLAMADRLLRDGGRLLVVHDYGRDDVSRLRPADLPEYTQ